MKIPVVAIALIGLVLLAGCKSTTVIDEYRETSVASIIGDESIVVLGRRHSSGYETEDDFISCVGKSLNQGQSEINVIPEKDFVDSMYPYFETSTAPMDVRNLGKLAQIPVIADKFNDFNLRYFVWIDGATERTDSSGSVSCAVGPGGGGCFGFAYWKDEANYEASIWDFKQLALSGKINAETKGTSFMPAIIIPIPMLARVQENACKSLANQIRTFFSEQPG
ncbi:MAG: hypothetical protein F4147_02575 [Gammaproteobacteria bacterium]|nr:hypothetical protein [Gammaproteobacteria bacterium]MYH69028.1 hypothetical protein [Gammaproteobacteria bacterium]